MIDDEDMAWLFRKIKRDDDCFYMILFMRIKRFLSPLHLDEMIAVARFQAEVDACLAACPQASVIPMIYAAADAAVARRGRAPAEGGWLWLY